MQHVKEISKKVMHKSLPVGLPAHNKKQQLKNIHFTPLTDERTCGCETMGIIPIQP